MPLSTVANFFAGNSLEDDYSIAVAPLILMALVDDLDDLQVTSRGHGVEYISDLSLFQSDQLGEILLARPAQQRPTINEARERNSEPAGSGGQAQIGANLINEAHSVIGAP